MMDVSLVEFVDIDKILMLCLCLEYSLQRASLKKETASLFLFSFVKVSRILERVFLSLGFFLLARI